MEEKKPIDIVKSVKTDVKKYRDQFNVKDDTEKAYYGEIWENDSKYKPTENHIFRIIEAIVPTMTDGLPGVVATTHKESMKPQVQNLSYGLAYLNKSQNLVGMLPVVVRQSLIGFPGYIHSYYDPNAADGDGEICREIIHGKCVWLDGSSPFIEKSNKAYYEVNRSRDWLAMSYPKYKDKILEIKSDSTQSEKSTDQIEKYDVKGRSTRKRPSAYKDDSTLKLCFTYLKDYSMVKIPEEQTVAELEKEALALAKDESPDVRKTQDHKAHSETHLQERAMILSELGLPGDAPFEQVEQMISQIAAESPESGVEKILFKLKILDNHIEAHNVLLKENPNGEMFKYPNNWRVIETIEKLVVYDGPNKYKHGQIPLVPFYAYKDHTIYGINEVENILDSQRMATVMTYKSYKGLQRVANPNLKVDKETGYTKEQITNEDGQIFFLPMGTDIRHMEPGMVSPQVDAFGKDRLVTMQELSGINEVTEGKSPHPNASGVTVEKLQLQSIGRQRLKIRQNLYYSLARLGELDASNILQFWTTEKNISVDTDDFSGEVLFNPLDMQDLEYSITIDEGSMAGVDKDAFNGLLYALLVQNRLTLPQFLKVADIPKKNELMKLVDDSEQTQAALQQLQQENLLLKGQFAPQELTPEEAQVFQEMVKQSGVANDQPGQPRI